VLSPDRRQYWDGQRWAPCLLSPDGRLIWNGYEWLLVDPGANEDELVRAKHYVAAFVVCLGIVLALLLIATLTAGWRRWSPDVLVVELLLAAAFAVFVLIPDLADSFAEGRLALPRVHYFLVYVRWTMIYAVRLGKPLTELPAKPRIVTASLKNMPWWVAAVVYGGMLGFLDNTLAASVGSVFALMNIFVPGTTLIGSWVVPLLLFGAAAALGVLISRRQYRRGPGAVLLMAFVAGFNDALQFALSATNPRDRALAPAFRNGILIGLVLSGAGLAGYFWDRWLQRRQLRPGAAHPAITRVQSTENRVASRSPESSAEGRSEAEASHATPERHTGSDSAG
jgi:hypothetical protein